MLRKNKIITYLKFLDTINAGKSPHLLYHFQSKVLQQSCVSGLICQIIFYFSWLSNGYIGDLIQIYFTRF